MLFDPSPVGERGQRALERIRERFGVADLPPAFALLARAEYGLHDLAMNLNRMMSDDQLPERTKLLVGLGVAVATGSAPAAEFFAAAALHAGRSPEEIHAAIGLATSMGLYNNYVRFRHQLPEALRKDFEGLRPGLNAEAVRFSVFAPIEKEAICIAVSSINDCVGCVESHVLKGREAGMSDRQIDETIKVVAVAVPLARSLAALTR